MTGHRVIAAERFFTAAKLHQILLAWGEQVRVYGDSTPEGWGWPNQSMDPRRQSKSTDGSRMTSPELAMFKLHKIQADIETVSRLVRDQPLVPRYSLSMYYVHQLTSHEDLALQLGTSVRCVKTALEEGRKAVRIGLFTLRGNVTMRGEPSYHAAHAA